MCLIWGILVVRRVQQCWGLNPMLNMKTFVAYEPFLMNYEK